MKNISRKIKSVFRERKYIFLEIEKRFARNRNIFLEKLTPCNFLEVYTSFSNDFQVRPKREELALGNALVMLQETQAYQIF